MRLVHWGTLAAALALLDCQSTVVIGGTSAGTIGTPATSAGTTAGGTIGGSSTGGTGSRGSSMGSSAGSSSGTTPSSGTSSTGGSSTGVPLPPIIDGGYVFCAADDAGTNWACQPGTYFCALDGGDNCFQCRSDSDCADKSLPTYDPNRQHCDLASGVVGYQNLCQQCIADADCAGNPAGAHCALQQVLSADLLPYEAASLAGAGFETCQELGRDCRTDGGNVCDVLDFVCNPTNGSCFENEGICTTDADCVGYLVSANGIGGAPTLGPYCPLRGGSFADCSSCAPDGGYCPSQCGQDSDCGNGMTCVGNFCACTSDTQCGGFWPVCVDAGVSDDLGQQVGYCSCDSDGECGDGGLACLPPVESNTEGVSFCGPPCTEPEFPTCSGFEPICDVTTGLCARCTTNEDCHASLATTNGSHCFPGGYCGCVGDADCPAGESCGFQGYCELPPAPCTRDCFPTLDACDSAYDCVLNGRSGHCCDEGFCGSCPGEPPLCMTASDCVGSASGTQCNTGEELFGYCACRSPSDCNTALAACPLTSQAGFGTCEPECAPNVDCPTGLSCDPGFACRPRCDDGGTCPPDTSLCDSDNRVGLNGESGQGAIPGAIWCYACEGAADCAAPLGCGASNGFKCGACGRDSDCRPGEACLDGGGCRSLCDAGVCPSGQVCVSNDRAQAGADVCYQCLGPSDCPGTQGCNSQSRTCGSCWGPNENAIYGTDLDCPPGDICSNYWTPGNPGACLQNCDVRACPLGTTCAVFTDLTPDHKYCFECRSDADCADAGPGAWCNLAPNPTFTCKVGPRQ